MVLYKRKKIMKKKETLTKTKYQEIFVQILSVAAQLIVAIFLITVLIWSIF